LLHVALPAAWGALLLLAGCAVPGAAPMIEPYIAPISAVCPPRAGGQVVTARGDTAEQAVDRVDVTADPDNAGVLMSRGWLKSRDGERDATIMLFDLALSRADTDTPVERIQWSYGWAMFNLHEHACALAHFDEARKAAPDQVRWVPYTLAVTYWQLGERDTAIRWYDHAARNEPGCWMDARAAGACSRYWLPQERRALRELFAAWKRFRVG
jgi:tetratricopeptide (TPR) repeat protein